MSLTENGSSTAPLPGAAGPRVPRRAYQSLPGSFPAGQVERITQTGARHVLRTGTRCGRAARRGGRTEPRQLQLQ